MFAKMIINQIKEYLEEHKEELLESLRDEVLEWLRSFDVDENGQADIDQACGHVHALHELAVKIFQKYGPKDEAPQAPPPEAE